MKYLIFSLSSNCLMRSDVLSPAFRRRCSLLNRCRLKAGLKTFCLYLFFVISNSIFVFAQCETEPKIEQTGKIIAAREFTVKDEQSEMILTLEAAAKNSSWAKVGACRNIRVIKLVRLDENYQPLVKKIESPPQNVETGDKAVFVLSRLR